MGNPTGKGGFGDNPQNRGNGRPKNEISFRAQLRRYMNMDETDVYAIAHHHRIIDMIPDYLSRAEVLKRSHLVDEPMTMVKRNALRALIASQSDLKLTLKLVTEAEGKPVTWNATVNQTDETEKQDKDVADLLENMMKANRLDKNHDLS